MANAEGKEFVWRVLSPLVAVAASPDVDELAKLNNLPSFADLLAPFGERMDGKVGIIDSQGHSTTLDHFTVRFTNANHLDRFDIGIVNKVVSDCMRRHDMAKKKLPTVKSKQDVEEVYGEVNMDSLTPWYTDYRNYLCKYTGASEHDTFNHPVSWLVVVSTANPDPVATAQSLSAENNLPAIFDRGYMDPNISKHYLLLHDEQTAPAVNAEALFEQMKKTFNMSACNLLNINSVPHPSTADSSDPFNQIPPPMPVVPDIWTPSQEDVGRLVDKLKQGLHSSSAASVASSVTSVASPTTEEGFPVFKDRSNVPVGAATGESKAETLGPLSSGVAGEAMLPPMQMDVPQLHLPSTVAYGNYLSEYDFTSLEGFVREFVTQKVIKNMERNIQHWNEQVASNRRGITGRLSRLAKSWGGGNRAQSLSPVAHTDSSGATIFPHNSPELIMRRLADYAFMLRDYRFAFSTYDSVRRDFQNNEKYVKFLAGTQEMLGLCTLLTDGLGRSLETYLEHSVTAYTEAKTPHYAARVAILYYEMLRHKNQLRDAPALLIRMTGEDSDLRSALFLEQAALCFLRMRPPMVRKYAFHLILAGHRFGKCGQREHAYRCYATALDVYDNLGWSLVEDHVHFTLGRQSFHLSHLDGAVDHFLKLLRKSRQPAPQQTAYLREFLYIYKQYATRATPDQISHFPALPVPEINDSTVRVSLLEHHSGQPTHVSAVDDEWETMERDLFEEGYTRTPSLGRKFYAGYKAPMSGGKDAGKTTCAVGEPVFVSFEMHNPMQVPIQAHNLFLECAFGTNPPARANLMYNPDVSPPERVEYAEFDAEVVGEVALEPGDTAVIQLRVFPKREGELIVHGVRYILCGSVPTHHPFQKRGRRQTDAVSIKSDTAVYAVDNSLKLVVTSPMPVLDVIFHAFPDTLLSGEVVRAVLEVNNKGNRGLRNLKLKTSHPSFFCVGDGGDMNDDSYAPRSSTQTPTSFESLTSPNHVNETSTVTIKLPTSDTRTNENGMLESGTTTLVPVWIRGDKIGKHVFRFLFGYQSEDKTDKVSYRTLRYSMTTTVQPSLRINAFTRPSARALDEFVLGIEIENLQKSSDVVLKQISSLSPSWIVQSIEEPALDDKTSHLPGGQTLFVYFRFGRAKVSVDPKNTPEALTTRAIERLILGEDEVGLRNEKIALNVSSLASAGNLVTCSSPAFQGLTTTSRLQWRLAQLSMQHSGLTPAQLSSLFTLYLTDDVDLALFWESPGPNGTVHRGHHYIIGINLGLQAPLQMQRLAQLAASKGGGAGRALYAETVREKKAVVASLLKVRQKDASPVRVVVKAAHEARGSFADGPCTFPITLVLRNTSRVSTARYMLETLHPGRAETDSQPPSTPGPPNAVSSSSSSPDFVWLGKTYASGVLPPQSETTVTLLACFARPGVYDVNRWRASVGLGGGEDGAGAGTYVQGPGLPHWVTVLNG